MMLGTYMTFDLSQADSRSVYFGGSAFMSAYRSPVSAVGRLKNALHLCSMREQSANESVGTAHLHHQSWTRCDVAPAA